MMLTACFLLSLSILGTKVQGDDVEQCTSMSSEDFPYATKTCNYIIGAAKDAASYLKHGAQGCKGGCGNLLNVAKNKNAKQSSLYTGIGTANKAVDNKWNPYWGGLSCTHTKRQPNPWWQVDLGQEYNIAYIIILNRQDCCSSRLSNVKILVGNDENNLHECNSHAGVVGSSLTLGCKQPTKARFVRIMLQKTEWLHLCEVAVMGN